MQIQRNTKIQIRKSPIHGWGVFACEDIREGEIIEECPILRLPCKIGETNYTLIDYTFGFPKNNSEHHVLAMGYGSFYNHSEEPNSTWEDDIEKETFKFIALKPILKDEEITIYYGGSEYWADGRNHVVLKSV